MLTRINSARYLGGHSVWLRFSDGLEGTVDLSRELAGEVFEPLRDEAFFARVTLHPELHTLVWPNGADFAPEFLREKLLVAA
jgi:hypothetical protein